MIIKIDKELIENNGITTEIIKKLIQRHESECLPKLQHLYNLYDNKHRIENRRMQRGRVNNKVTMSYPNYLTTIKSGYIIGNDVEYTSDQDLADIINVYKNADMGTTDLQAVTDMSIFGYSFELVYNDEEANPTSKILDARNVIYVTDNTLNANQLFTITYNLMTDIEGNPSYYKIAAYGKDYNYFYKTSNSSLNSLSSECEIFDNYFGECQVILHKNNMDRKSDYFNIESLLDALEKLQSDRINSVEKFVNSVLKIQGIGELSKEQREQIEESAYLLLPQSDMDASYLDHTLDQSQIEILRQDLIDDIHKFAMIPNISDVNFAGNSSGVALAYKLLSFNLMVQGCERLYMSGLRKRMRLYNVFLNKKTNCKIIDVNDVTITFKHSLPQNSLELAQIVNLLGESGIVDKETLAAILPFVSNAQETVMKAEEEAEERRTKAVETFTAQNNTTSDDNNKSEE